MGVFADGEVHEKLHVLLFANSRKGVQSDIDKIPNALIINHNEAWILLNDGSRNEAIHIKNVCYL